MNKRSKIILEEETSRRITLKTFGIAKFDSPYRPLSMDPFSPHTSLSGKIVAAALADEYNFGAAYTWNLCCISVYISR